MAARRQPEKLRAPRDVFRSAGEIIAFDTGSDQFPGIRRRNGGEALTVLIPLRRRRSEREICRKH